MNFITKTPDALRFSIIQDPMLLSPTIGELIGESDASLLAYLHKVLPPSEEEMRNLRAQQRRQSPGVGYDQNGQPPPEEKTFAFYTVTRNIGSLALDHPNQGMDTPTYLTSWSRVAGQVVDVGIRREGNGTWTLYLGFGTIREAWLSAMLAPAWVEHGRRWYTYVATSKWS